MSIIRYKILITLILLTIKGLAQFSTIEGKWIKKKIIYERRELLKSYPFNGYFEYKFLREGKGSVSYSPFREDYNFYYKINKNNLTLGDAVYKIDSLTNQVLVLSFNTGDIVTKEIFYRGQDIRRTATEISVKTYLDTTKFYKEYKFPELKGKKNLHEFLNDNVSYEGESPISLMIRFSLSITRNGNIDKLLFLDSCSSIMKRAIKDAIYKTNGLWTPAMANGNFIEFKLVNYFVIRSAAARKLKNKEDYGISNYFFNKGVVSFKKENFNEANIFFSEALAFNFNSLKNDLYFNRSLVRLKLGNKEGACEDLHHIYGAEALDALELINSNCNK